MPGAAKATCRGSSPKQGAIVTGIDSSAELIKAAQSHEQASKLPASFDVGTVDCLPYEAGLIRPGALQPPDEQPPRPRPSASRSSPESCATAAGL